MAIVQLEKQLCGEDNHGSVWELDVAFQTSVNGATLLAGSEVDVRPFKYLSIIYENITNDVTFRLIGSHDSDFTRFATFLDYAMTAGATAIKWHSFTRTGLGSLDSAPPGTTAQPYRYLKFEIWSTVGGVHGDARVRYTGWK